MYFSFYFFFFFKQKTAYEMRISDWSSDVCSSDLPADQVDGEHLRPELAKLHRALLGDDDSDQKAHQPDDAQRVDAHHLELVQHRIDAEQARVAHQLPHRHHHLAEELDKGDQHLERLHCGAAHVGEDAGKRRARVGPYLRGLVAFPHLCDQARSEEHT